MVDVRFPAGDYGLARYNPDGSLDSSFGTGGEIHSTGRIFAAAIAADGKIDAVGSNAAFRYNADGSVDNTFGTGGTVTMNVPNGCTFEAVALQSNGDIVAAGSTPGGNLTYPMLVARYLPSEPEIGSFTASPNPVATGSSETLTVSGITDGNAGATITQVAFYYLDGSGNKVTLGYGTQTSPGVWTFTSNVNLAAGTYTLYGQAEDSYGVFGDPFALPFTVQ